MAWSAPHVFVTGEVVTAATLNTYVTNNLLVLDPTAVGSVVGATALTFVPAGNTDTPLSGTATWVTLGNVTVPTNATKAIMHYTAAGIFAAIATGGSVSVAAKIGTAISAPARRLSEPNVLGQRYYHSAHEIFSLGGITGVQSVTLSATWTAGTGVQRVDTASFVAAGIEWLGA